jgi:hypothetical protein
VSRVLRTADDLARQLKVTLPSASVAENGYRTTSFLAAAEEVDLDAYPMVQVALDDVGDDRSEGIWAVVDTCAHNDLSPEQALWVCRQHADLAKKLDEIGDGDVMRCWVKSMSRIARNRREVDWTTNSAHTGAGTKSGSKTDEPSDDPTAGSRLIDGASFILDNPQQMPAQWGEGQEVIWPEGESFMIAGSMGLGKTTLELLLMRARLGLGDGTLLGYPVTPCEGIILYLAMDRPAQIARAAYRIFTEQDREILRKRVKIWKGPPPADIAKRPEILTMLAEKADAADVFLDSIKDAALGLSEDEVGAGYNRARQHLLATGRQLAECHHTTKRGRHLRLGLDHQRHRLDHSADR